MSNFSPPTPLTKPVKAKSFGGRMLCRNTTESRPERVSNKLEFLSRKNESVFDDACIDGLRHPRSSPCVLLSRRPANLDDPALSLHPTDLLPASPTATATIHQPNRRPMHSGRLHSSKSASIIATKTAQKISLTPKSSNSNLQATSSTPILAPTPLSSLIKQSFQDIQALRRVSKTPSLRVDPGPELQQELDFERVEQNLKRFEDVYTQFLQCGRNEGEPIEEVHLMAMVCRRSGLVSGVV
ncbi:unnamed protein product [Blumeria hordei]|uniref:Uncharacterized protein n=1 Tax=Blumeria hordei TaxID=2867405 RepID=A0A383UIN7_BLUHO|nr:unnamed protein product [Blumeria hordei]